MPFHGTAEDRQALSLVPPGTYRLVVEDAEKGISKNGNDKILMRMRVDLPEGNGPAVFETLTDTPKAEWRSNAFALAAGIAKKGEPYDLEADDLIGLSLSAELVIETGDDKKERNKVGRYICKGVTARAERPPREMPADDIPF